MFIKMWSIIRYMINIHKYTKIARLNIVILRIDLAFSECMVWLTFCMTLFLLCWPQSVLAVGFYECIWWLSGKLGVSGVISVWFGEYLAWSIKCLLSVLSGVVTVRSTECQKWILVSVRSSVSLGYWQACRWVSCPLLSDESQVCLLVLCQCVRFQVC